jgi:hypothetical protein
VFWHTVARAEELHEFIVAAFIDVIATTAPMTKTEFTHSNPGIVGILAPAVIGTDVPTTFWAQHIHLGTDSVVSVPPAALGVTRGLPFQTILSISPHYSPLFSQERASPPHPPQPLGCQFINQMVPLLLRSWVYISGLAPKFLPTASPFGLVLVKFHTQDSPQQDSDRDLALAVNLNGKDIPLASLELEPGSSVRDELGHT